MKISEIENTHTKIIRKLVELQDIQIQTHSRYKEYIEKNRVEKVFGLDSFYYQSRLFDLEMKQVKEQYSFVNNRIYCDYYKLYGMVKTFYKEHFKTEPKKRNYIPYKDLEPYKQFEFSDSMNLNQDITEMIKKSLDFIRKKEEEVGDTLLNQHLNIDNYIYNYRYNNQLLKTKVELYEKYLNSYHIYHMSFLSNLLEKVLLLFRQNTSTANTEPFEHISIQSVPEVPPNQVEEFHLVESDKGEDYQVVLTKSPENIFVAPVDPVKPVIPVEPVVEPVIPVVPEVNVVHEVPVEPEFLPQDPEVPVVPVVPEVKQFIEQVHAIEPVVPVVPEVESVVPALEQVVSIVLEVKEVIEQVVPLEQVEPVPAVEPVVKSVVEPVVPVEPVVETMAETIDEVNETGPQVIGKAKGKKGKKSRK